MKKSKKLILGVLSLALLVSGFGFASSAETAPEPENYEAILEYYSQPTFLVENFNGAATGAFTADYVLNGASVTDAHQKAEIKDDGTNKYLVLNTASFGDANSRTGNFCLGWTSDTYANGVIADFSVFGQGSGESKYTCTGSYTDANGKEKLCGAKIVTAAGEDAPTVCDKCGNEGEDLFGEPVQGIDPIVHIYLDSAKDDLSAKTVNGTELLTLDFSQGTVSYLLADGTYATLELELEAGKWYNVTFELNCLTQTYDLTVTDATDSNKTAAVADVAAVPTLKTVKTVRFNTLRKNNENFAQQIAFDNISIVGGSFRRNDAEKQAKTEEALIRYAELCNQSPALPLADRSAMIDVYTALVETYGFTSTKADVQVAMNALGQKSVFVYAELVESCVNTIDYEGGYYARLAHINGYARYFEKIPHNAATLEALVGAENVAKVLGIIDDYNNEHASIEQLKADSIAFIEKVGIIDITVNDYAVLVATRNEVATITPDPYYDGVEVALSIFNSLNSKIKTIEDGAVAFINNVASISSGTGFSEKYQAFCNARAGYFDNATYPGVTEALLSYEAQREIYEPIETECKEYILWVERAFYSSYVNAKEENLKKADACNPDGLEPEFPGIAAAKATHAGILTEIAEKRAAAAAYVAAVEALAGLTGAELEAGIAHAKELKKTGDIPGIDNVDVTGANITLTNLEASITLYIAQSRQFVSLVGKIAEADGLAARFAAINEARRKADKATDSHEGVTAAKLALAAAITEYNADVAAVNGAYAAVNATAADLLTSAAENVDASAITTKVVALVKKIFE